MTSTFLHQDRVIPPDEVVDPHAPTCECGHAMWLTQIETRVTGEGTDRKREYECKLCGAAKTVFAHNDFSNPGLERSLS